MGQKCEHLGTEERDALSAMKQENRSMREIAGALRRSPATISREPRRNGWEPDHKRGPMGRPAIAGGYNAANAGRWAARLRRKPRCERKLHPDGTLWPEIPQEAGLSPEQVSAQLERVHPEESALNVVSHETICHAAIYAAPRGALRRELIALQGRSTRKPRTRGQDRRGKLVDMLSIHVRPPEANDRFILGHWESDLIKGTGSRSAVGTLIDRSTLFVMRVKIDGSTAEAAPDACSAAFAPLPQELRKTLTYD